MDSMAQQIERIEPKLTAQSVSVDRIISDEAVRAFEARHGVRLPEEYRDFITTIGNGCGTGPLDGGLVQLGAPICGEPWLGARYWLELPDILVPFPFTEPWIWESWDHEDETFDEGDFLELTYGCHVACLS